VTPFTAKSIADTIGLWDRNTGAASTTYAMRLNEITYAGINQRTLLQPGSIQDVTRAELIPTKTSRQILYRFTYLIGEPFTTCIAMPSIDINRGKPRIKVL